jgi:hypothetical protein
VFYALPLHEKMGKMGFPEMALVRKCCPQALYILPRAKQYSPLELPPYLLYWHFPPPNSEINISKGLKNSIAFTSFQWLYTNSFYVLLSRL